jgi:hypothetical protein
MFELRTVPIQINKIQKKLKVMIYKMKLFDTVLSYSSKLLQKRIKAYKVQIVYKKRKNMTMSNHNQL